MSMNGSKGRAKEMARIKRGIDRDAAAAGIDVSDRSAVRRWHDDRTVAMCERIQRNSGKDVADWK
jgi:hypothetical protein